MTGVRQFASFSPDLEASGPLTNYWLRQAMLRIRREICWLWRDGAQSSPDRTSESLNRVRFWEEKQEYFESDRTAHYLTQQISATRPPALTAPQRGSFAWVVETADMSEAAAFVLALGLIPAFDSASGPAIAACHNDANLTLPTLRLAQQLWDAPEEMLALVDRSHALFRFGLLATVTDWDTPLRVPELVARRLLFEEPVRTPQLTWLKNSDVPCAALGDSARMTALRLRGEADEMRVVPVLARPGASAVGAMAAISEITGRGVVQLRSLAHAETIAAAMTVCWLDGADLLLRPRSIRSQPRLADALMPCASIPVTVYV